MACKSSDTILEPTDHPEDFITAVAQVHDFSQLDGCTTMLVTSDGLKLLPQSARDVQDLAIGQYIRVVYKTLVDNASICMAEDYIIHIVSVELLPLEDYLPDCDIINAPAESQWLTSNIRQNQIKEVQRYQYGPHKLYWCIDTEDKTVIYDCVGHPLCKMDKDQKPKCQDWIDKMVFEFTIYDRSFRK